MTRDHDRQEHHDHTGHSHSHAPASFGTAFAIGIALNLTYAGGEAVCGLLAHSMALLAVQAIIQVTFFRLPLPGPRRADLVTPSTLPNDQLLDDAAGKLRVRDRIAHATLQV